MGQGTTSRIEPPLPEQQQRVPGATEAMHPKPDHGEDSYEGSGRLEGKGSSSPAVTAGSVARSQSPSRAKARMC